MMGWNDMVMAEVKRYVATPTKELRQIRLALALHRWGTTLQENARAEAVEQIIHGRLARKMEAA